MKSKHTSMWIIHIEFNWFYGEEKLFLGQEKITMVAEMFQKYIFIFNIFYLKNCIYLYLGPDPEILKMGALYVGHHSYSL